MKKYIFLVLSILLIGLAGLGIGEMVRASTADLSATVSITTISVTIDPTTFDYGPMDQNTSQVASDLGTVTDITVTNDSNVAVDLDIKGANTSATTDTIWTLAATVGEDQYTHEFSNTIGFTGGETALSTTDAVLTTGLAIDGTHDFDLRITTPSSFSTAVTGDQHTVPVTVTATEAA